MAEKERAAHFLRIFEESKKFTEELLKENEALRLHNLKIRRVAKELHERMASSEVETMRRKLAEAEERAARNDAELLDLKRQVASIEEENREFAERYVRIERQNGSLASLYVASLNLHTTLDHDLIVQYIKEIVINMIGSEMFGIYVAEESQTSLTLVAHEGLEDSGYHSLEISGLLEEAMQTRRPAIRKPGVEGPLVCIPLTLDGRMVGAIQIFKLLDHKQDIADIDKELLELLSGQAATALYSAKLYADSERKLKTFRGLFSLLTQPEATV